MSKKRIKIPRHLTDRIFQMKFNLLKVTLSVVILFFSGCVPMTKTTPIVEKKPDVSYRSDGRYYYYTEAQIQKKKGNLDKAVEYLKKTMEYDAGSSYLLKELVILYLRQKDNEKALGVVENMLEQDPDNVEALIIYGRIKQDLKQFDDAKKAYEKILAIDPRQNNIYLLLGGLYVEEGNLARASQIYKQLVKYFPKWYVGHYFLGKAHAKQGKAAEAEKEFQKTLELKPEIDEPRFELINIYKKLGKGEQVLKLYKEILKKNPKNIRAAIGLGYYYHTTGGLSDSEHLLKDLGIRSLSDPKVIKSIIQFYFDKKKYDSAIIILEGMRKGAPDSSDIHYLKGVAFDRKGDEDRALKHFQQVRPKSKFYQNAAVHISFLYQEQGKIKEAIDFLKQVIQNVPDNPELMIYLGSFYEETGELAKALETLKQGIKIDPDNSKLHFRLGIVYDKLGRKDDSIETMKTVIKLDPKNASALNYLGYTYADLGKNLDEAERLIKEALKYRPNDGYITDSLGWVYFKKGLYTKALKLLEKAISLAPDDPIILEHLGDTYLRMNSKEKALQFYKNSLLKRKKDKTGIEKKIQELTEKEF